MIYVQVGLVAAMLVGLGMQMIYGSDHLLEASWLDPLFWGLIGGGVAVAALDGFYCSLIHCPLRRLMGGRPRRTCREVRCGDTP